MEEGWLMSAPSTKQMSKSWTYAGNGYSSALGDLQDMMMPTQIRANVDAGLDTDDVHPAFTVYGV